MRPAMLIDATDLTFWANRRNSQSTLPQLVRRLVHATADRVFRSGFPAGEGVQLGGYDGVVAVEQGNAFVPDDTSIWELGVNRDIKAKANSDYEKRKDSDDIDPAQSTFVFVTPRRWGGKADWITSRQAEGVWREVRAYDADDLEEWLELAPAVHIWLSILLGKHPEKATDLQNFWDDWSTTTQPQTSLEFILSGRDDVVQIIQGSLSDTSTSLALRAESRDEVLAIFAATLQQLEGEQRIAALSRTVIAYDVAAWNRLTAADQPLILIRAFDDHNEAIGRAIRTGHKVVIPLGRADSSAESTVEIPRLSREEAQNALMSMGISEVRARDLATLARRSLTSFRRKLAISPEVQQPEWARPENARSLLPLMLAGGWNATQAGDREVAATLAQVPYEEISPTLVRWSNETDPPVRRIEDTWFINSKEDAWSLLARTLVRDDLERFEGIVLNVLGTPDPRFDLPEERRWMAAALGQSPQYSGLIQEGIAETLAIMGAQGDVSLMTGNISVSASVMRIVQRLLECANADWQVWASLSHVLPLLAEAAPDIFLDAVEAGIHGDPSAVLPLFSDRQNGLFSSSPHTGLLWALETLAWSPEYLSRAALLLARLARLAPDVKMVNRPQNSLCTIFLLWLPQTMASLEQRCRTLDLIREREPEVAWQLLQGLLLKFSGSTTPTPKPRWREWGTDLSQRPSPEEEYNACREVVSRMLNDVGERGTRWRDLIEALPMLPVDQHETIVERLANMNAENLSPPDRTEIWNALRELISRHRSFHDADWALPKERVDHLYEVFQAFEPQEVIGRYSWLFSNNPALPEGRQGDWNAFQEALTNARLAAVRTIYKESGLEGSLEFIDQVEQPGEVGFALGQSGVIERVSEDKILSENLASEDSNRSQFARGVVCGRLKSQGREWIARKVAEVTNDWSPKQRAEVLTCLPYDEQTLRLVENSGPETEQSYWRLLSPFGIPDAHTESAGRKLLQHNRPYAAVHLLALRVPREQPRLASLIVDVLEGLLQSSAEDSPSGSSSHDISELFEVLEESPEVDDTRLAQLEWAFLPALGQQSRRTPTRLHRELTRNPDFFAELTCLAFRAEGEEPKELSEEEEVRVERAYQLLTSWRTIPGVTQEGGIDSEILKDWILRAREITTASGHRASSDRIIGQVLSSAPLDADKAWPHVAVREVIEAISSDDLESGLEISLYNSRGVIVKDPFAGGGQELQLVERYTNYAQSVSARWPRTAAMLRRIADHYRAYARREDNEAELRMDFAR